MNKTMTLVPPVPFSYLIKLTLQIVVAIIVLSVARPVVAVIVVDGGASFSLSTLATPPFDDAGKILAKSGITTSGPASNGTTTDNLIDDAITSGFPNNEWFNSGPGNGATTDIHEVTFTFDPPVNLEGVLLNWAWADRDDGEWEFLINGTATSLGTFDVTGGGNTYPSHAPSPFLFDSVQKEVTSFVLRVDKTGITGNKNDPALSEVTFYGAVVPEPSTFALSALGLCWLGMIGWRRRTR